MEPYFRGTVSPMIDEPYEGIELGTRISKLRESMCNLHSLQMKLKVLIHYIMSIRQFASYPILCYFKI